MTILVTGSAGMIGSYVVIGLIEKGHTVIGVDRRKNDNVNPNDNRLTQIVLDLASKDDVLHVFEKNKIDRCIHLAALAHTKGVKDTSFEAFKKCVDKSGYEILKERNACFFAYSISSFA